MAHKETGLGVYEDKVLKAQSKAGVIWNNLKGKKSRGIIAFICRCPSTGHHLRKPSQSNRRRSPRRATI